MTTYAAVYSRLSLDRDGKAENVADQTARAKAYAATRGWTVRDADVFEDNSVSASKAVERAGFEAMLKGLLEGRFNVVIARHIDRIIRNRLVAAQFLDECQKRGTMLAMWAGGEYDMSTSTGRSQAGLMAEFARMESDIKSERQTLAHERRVKSGKYFGALPFGWDDSGAVVESEAAHIRSAVKTLIDGGSIAEVVRSWNAAGLKTKRVKGRGGNDWTASTFSKFIRDPKLAGYMTHQGKIVDGVTPEFSEIIDKETHRLLMGVLNDPQRKTYDNPKGRDHTYLLTGIAVDPLGRNIIMSATGGRKQYRSFLKRDNSAEGRVARQIKLTDEAVINDTLTVLTSPLLTHILYTEDDQLAQQARLELLDVTEERKALTAQFKAREIKATTYEALSDALDEQEAAAGEKLSKARRKDLFNGLDLESFNTLGAHVARHGWGELRVRWDDLPLHQRRSILTELWERIEVQPGRDKPVRCTLAERITNATVNP